MRALCWNAPNVVKVETVPDPILINPNDIIVRITSTAICGSDLHLFNGFIPGMRPGDILGHEFMGEVVDVGPAISNLQRGDRVVVPFAIGCGRCFYCEHDLWSLCDNSNTAAGDVALEAAYGAAGAGLFGYSHLYGGYSGGQAEYVRVPFADVGPVKVPDGLPDEQVLFLTDIFPTGYMAAENCNIKPGDVVAVWGCGPVGLFAIASAYLLGAEKVIAIDRIEERLQKAANECRAIPINYLETDVVEELRTLTGGRGPDAVIDAVGMEAHATGLPGLTDRVKQTIRMETDRPHVLREAIQACRKGGTVSIPGVYGGVIDTVNMGAAFAKGLTFKMGQTHVQRYMKPLMERIQRGEIDPSFVITHTMSLEDAAEGYAMFRAKQDGCVKVVLKPDGVVH
ncbi:MAG: glutathione-dependent formaldehyde dehydrogenase [Anaerolineae bacterium]|nr:glutathione-dependent formaldehyde dehydrogenase [Anaerolineae bacterium]